MVNWVRDNTMPSSTGDTPSIAYRPAVILPKKKMYDKYSI